MSISRESEWIALNEQWKDLLGLPWTGRRIYGCYEIIRKYWEYTHGRQLIDFNSRGIISFSDEAIEEGGAEWTYKKEWGDELDYTPLQFENILVFKLYTNPLGGSYSAPAGRAPNHGGVYLGNGFMLHHPYDDVSQLADLKDKTSALWGMSCVGAIRVKSI